MVNLVFNSNSAPPPGGGTVDISIVKRTLTQTAPEAIMFDITDMSAAFTVTQAPAGSDYNHEIHDFAYIWDFGDVGSEYSAVTYPIANWKNRNRGYSKKAGHVYRTPGTYTVSVWIVDLTTGATATGSTTVTVAAFSSLANYRSVTIGSDPSDDYPTVFDAFVADAGETDPTEYLIRRGHTEDGEGITLRYRGHVKVDAFGTGAMPVMTFSPCQQPGSQGNAGIYCNGAVTSAFFFTNTHWRSDYNSVDNSFVYGGTAPTYMFDFITEGFGSFVIDACTISNCNSAVQANTNASLINDTKLFCLHDSTLADWMNYGMYLDDFVCLILGNKFMSDPNCTSGWGSDTGFDRHHGPIRWGASSFGVIDGNRVVSLAGWFPNAPYYGSTVETTQYNISSVSGTFITGETITWSGGNSGILRKNEAGRHTVTKASGSAPSDGTVVTGSTSGATATASGGSNLSLSTQQPVFRWNQGSTPDAEGYFTRNAGEGGWAGIDMTPTQGGNAITQQNVYVDGWYHIGSFMNQSFIDAPYGGITAVNVIWLCPSVTRTNGIFEPKGLINLVDGGSYVDNGDVWVKNNPIRIRNCEIIDLTGLSAVAFVSGSFIGGATVDTLVEDSQIWENPTSGTHDLTKLWDAEFLGYHAPNGDNTDSIAEVTPRLTLFATTDDGLRYEQLSKVAASSTRPPYWNIAMTTRSTNYKGAW